MNISIIIPTYNREKLLKRCLSSVFKEEGDFEVIVIDDASTDNTEKTIKEFGDLRLRYLKQEKNGGVNKARNRAIREASGEWLFCLDDDDEILLGSISLICKRIAEMPNEFNVAFFNSLIRRDGGDFIGGYQYFLNENYFDPTYRDTMFKYGLKGDCKPVFKKTLFNNKRYLFPEVINGFESYTINLISKDKKGIRYWQDVITLIHQEDQLKDRLSLNASRKNPWPLFVLHTIQIPEHFWFYIKHPLFFSKKLITMSKLLLRSSFIFFRSS